MTIRLFERIIWILLVQCRAILKNIRVDFHCRVIFTSVNKMEAMYRKPHADVKVAPGSTVTFTRPSIHYLCFIYASKVYVRTRVQNYSTEEICPKTIEIA